MKPCTVGNEFKSQRYFVERYGATINSTWDKNWPHLINEYLPGHWWASSCCWSPKPGLASWWTWARPACPRSKFSRNTWSRKKEDFTSWSRNPRLTFYGARMPGSREHVSLADGQLLWWMYMHWGLHWALERGQLQPAPQSFLWSVAIIQGLWHGENASFPPPSTHLS